MVMPWLLALLLLAAVGVVLLVLLRPGNGPQRPSRDAQDGGPRRLANSVSLFDLPQVRSRITHRRWLHAAMAGLIVVALVAASAIAARPVREVERTDRLANRDIVLCLDVSTSMVGVDASVLKTFADLVESFDGERVALVAWNSSAQTIVPLTDDYELLQTEMEDLADVLDIDPDNPTSLQATRYALELGGTIDTSLDASSLAGDGLASCATAFDNQGLDRSRSIIFATDNQVIDPYHEQIYPLPDATELLAERQIRLFSIFGADERYSGDWEAEKTLDEGREELKTLTEGLDGRFYEVEDSGAGGDIVEQLESTQVAELGGNTEVKRTDVPETLSILLSFTVLALLGLVAWRRA
ncbi:VWA domain-containing protein [Actinomyces bowdenii]|uniref:VWA domain-containing protein n=2 Tax=Actinomyces bowdenii TaxID=131109 RepID=A0A853EM90_9ACTO|nr:VWA domain-containing protein [Actinomyces bowdenii]NYS69362.1 VWA domain-containing protein [Actinomyces bowdenii]